MSTERPSSAENEIAPNLHAKVPEGGMARADCPHVGQWLERENDSQRNKLSIVTVSGELVRSYGFEMQARLCPWCMGQLAAHMTEMRLVVYAAQRKPTSREGM